MIRFLHRHLLLPAFETGVKRRKTFAYWRELERTQWLSRQKLEGIQFESLKRLIRHAWDRSSHYRATWQNLGLHPNRLQAPADFSAWPIITRQTIRDHREHLRAAGAGRLICKSTGGSSGEPLQFDLDLNSNDRRNAAWHRGYSWAGAAPGTRQFYLWGVNLRRQSQLRKWKENLHNRLYRKRVCSSFDLAERKIPTILRELNACRPDAIVAYTKPLYELSRYLDEHGIRPFSPRSIVVGAEKLHDFERQLIERVFAAPVFETYGSREFMLIGAECANHHGLHLTMENLLLEILDDAGRPAESGEQGNVVITDLYNYGMPFVRYATGDRAVAGFDNCSCGRGLPLLRKVVGRQLDILRTPDGRMVPGEFFPHLIKDYRPVRRYQVIQEQLDLVRLRLVADSSWNPQMQCELESLVRRQLGPMVRFELQQVQEIPLSASGKLQVVVNHTIHRKAA
jgi:phenylacetate-CoA ligase